ncbi:MAG TPA: LPP20 family lipoprotein [Nitrospiraceae bacterium]|nr:LPP20 family lipoprotein [Nitrospiraceae bacterium]
MTPHWQGSVTTHAVTALMLAIILAVSGCAAGGPSWIRGENPTYPSARFLTGVGQGDSKATATERAYGAVAKVFHSEVTAQSRDWESFWVLEKRGQSNTERKLSLEQITNVSTDKVLENVTVLDTWIDPKTRQHYALAGMDRAQAETAMLERLRELDQAVDSELEEARQTSDKLARVRNLRRAIKNLVLREAHNADLRVIRTSGQGSPASHRVADLTTELERFLSTNLHITVEVAGDQADATRRAVSEGLIREGLPVVGHMTEAGPNGAAQPAPDLFVRGAVQLWEVPVPDPLFRYARWCSDFSIMEPGSERMIGAVSIGGREGHVTSTEAMSRAFRVMQQELTSHLAKTLAAYIYGEAAPPAARPPAACPASDKRR